MSYSGKLISFDPGAGYYLEDGDIESTGVTVDHLSWLNQGSNP
ncbi:MAG: hypothetical protein WBF13_08790 [Candidatus Zixiibacteriota bacterium]